MNKLGLSFEKLKTNFSFESKEEFIEQYLGDIAFVFSRAQKFNPKTNLEIALFILEHFKVIKEKIKTEYEITPFSGGLFSIAPRVIFSSDPEKFKEVNYEWLGYTKCKFDSELEKSFLDFIASKKDEINGNFRSGLSSEMMDLASLSSMMTEKMS